MTVEARREGDEQVQVAVVGRFEGVNVVAPVMAGYDDGQVVVLHEVPCDEGPRDAAVAVGEGVNLGEPVVEPRGDQQGVVGVGLGGVLAVPGEQVVEFRVNVFGWAVLVDAAVGPASPTFGRWLSHCWSSSSSCGKSCAARSSKAAMGCQIRVVMSEVARGAVLGLVLAVHAVWAVGGADVAELALLVAGYSSCRFFG